MAQRRIDDFFQSIEVCATKTVTPKTTFLDLPLSVRRRIYAETELIPLHDGSWSRIVLNDGTITERLCQFHDANTKVPLVNCHQCIHQRPRRNRNPIHYPVVDSDLLGMINEGCSHPHLPYQLFFVSRAISQDARSFFYSQNKFQINYTGPGKLSVLEKLGSIAIAAMRNLTIRMNMCTCSTSCKKDSHASDCHQSCKEVGHDMPLGYHPKSHNDKQLLVDLKRVCEHLRNDLVPNRLGLTFICDSVDHILASQVMNSLLLLPRLKWCSIMLSRSFDFRLRQIAEETRIKLIGEPDCRVTKAFPLRDLPKELELEVLRHTGVINSKHLRYNPRSMFPTLFTSSIEIRCMYTNDLGIYSKDHSNCSCCCCNSHSTSTWSCNCRRFPYALFSVDWEMNHDMRTIMYRENAWELHIARVARDAKTFPSVLANLSFFLLNVRDLTVVCSSWYLADTNGIGKAFIRGLLDQSGSCPEKLALGLVLSHPNHFATGLTTDLHDTVWRTHHEAASVLLQHLRRRTFSDFFVFTERLHNCHDDYAGVAFTKPCRALGNNSIHGLIDQIDKELEAMVMGADYDSQKRGKNRRMHISSGNPYLDNMSFNCWACGLETPGW